MPQKELELCSVAQLGCLHNVSPKPLRLYCKILQKNVHLLRDATQKPVFLNEEKFYALLGSALAHLSRWEPNHSFVQERELHSSLIVRVEMAPLIWCIILIKMVSAGEQYNNNGILHHINTGMNFAKDFLGSESIALKVADFVVRAFQPHKQPVKQEPIDKLEETVENGENYSKENEFNINQGPPLSPWRHLIRLLGLQPNQISAVAVNALIFVAQMITTLLAGPKQSNKNYRDEDPLKYVLSKNSMRLQQLIATARNESLPDLINKVIEEQESEEETSCIRLLICKITPFIEKMQHTVFSEDQKSFDRKVRGADILYRHLPETEEINSRSDICERKFKDCNLNE